MPVLLRAVAFAAHDLAAVATFWASLLGRPDVEDGHGVLVPGDGEQLGLRFVPRPAQRTELNRMHVHLTSASLEHQRATVARALQLGARHYDAGQLPEEGHVVLADPAGNAFCVIEPGNAFLADCGFLGELACDGSRKVGVFWSGALDWPLVWDQDEETAVQSPQGGTKIAWGGKLVGPVDAIEPQHFELVVVDSDLAVEVDRLIGLGAARLDHKTDGSVVLADPDGFPFRIYRN